ncbi:1,2-phenylacetyl-CoA epoxidase subunit PaaC [Pseudalkalibacillus berkeleyi]|uniref:Phenylacetate-CoA oxygenase subunit PaaC n=1 Tax=Pseudalkalibacillus berkeleyi TaxID=1069813 RepID=A0ABS9GTQ8_9BACL|nr:1,2-phenylacetyl-CoA epoxidase subunit PaaC [Pseudalkalibacillus berkeleyi]MCF6136227.1 phenylacetate-CoA oxygenase subunit PaaC [Pseudalkalibacillus berkeleyi]
MAKDKALVELLYTLADDDFILAYRGSEWLGLAPHIEEDVAYSSINQDMMGHAAKYYQILEELGEGDADELSHLRSPDKFRNAVLLEEKNGEGTYLEQPNYDWAFAVVRNYFYSIHKKVRLESLRKSNYEPLSDAAKKISIELQYHLMHWETWFKQLMMSSDEAKRRMGEAVEHCWNEMDGIISLGPFADEMVEKGYVASEASMREKWLDHMKKTFEQIGAELPGELGMTKGNGRQGEHTEDLTQALKTLSEVYETNPAAGW